MIPRGARANGMAYWHKREAQEREGRCRPRSTAGEHAAINGINSGPAGSSDRDANSGGGGDTEASSEGNGQWEDEKEEVGHLYALQLLLLFCRSPAHYFVVRFSRSSSILRHDFWAHWKALDNG